MDEGEFGPGFESGLDGHAVKMFDTQPKEAVPFNCVCGQRGQERRIICLGPFTVYDR